MHAYQLQNQLGATHPAMVTRVAPPPQKRVASSPPPPPPVTRMVPGARHNRPPGYSPIAAPGSAVGVRTWYGTPYTPGRSISVPRSGAVPRPIATPSPRSTSHSTARRTAARTVVIDPDFQATLPFFDEARRFTYTREQLREMKDRARAVAQELETRQTREGGDGIAEDLEQKAAEEAATEEAVREAVATGIPSGDARPAAAPKGNLAPLALAAALAYFLL